MPVQVERRMFEGSIEWIDNRDRVALNFIVLWLKNTARIPLKYRHRCRLDPLAEPPFVNLFGQRFVHIPIFIHQNITGGENRV